ncbi:MAG: polysaccharide biosynthesis protein PslG [Thermoleophilaceae bacterium]|jgi:hypothetical protein|nr:polysaccharide biosynthesis protein PslG [Thermoleophilaceae bacterium]
MSLRSCGVLALLLLALMPPATAGAWEVPNPEVDQYLEVVPDARGGRPAVDIQRVAPAADTEHCVNDPDPVVAAVAAAFVTGGGGGGIMLPLALVVVGLGLAGAAVSRRRAVAIAALLVACLIVPAAAGADVDFGVMAGRDGAGTLSQDEFQRMRLGGTDVVRTTLDWELVQPAKGGPYDFTSFDQIMAGASGGQLPRVQVLPILFGSPSWVRGADTSNEPATAPADMRAWARFVRAAVARYGPHGSFWAENQGAIDSGRLHYNPVYDWQVWNEPNLSPFWTKGRPDAREYAQLLRITDEAIKTEDPRAKTVLAGMLERQSAPLPMSEFLRDLYRVKGIGDHFDVLAPQPFVFVKDSRLLAAALRRVRSVADSNGDGDKPIFITEIGVASNGPKTDLTTDEKGQAAALREFFGQIERLAGGDRIEKAIWFQWRDGDVFPPSGPDSDRWQTYTGLFTADGRPKPAWQAFCAINRGVPGQGALPSRPGVPAK